MVPLHSIEAQPRLELCQFLCPKRQLAFAKALAMLQHIAAKQNEFRLFLQHQRDELLQALSRHSRTQVQVGKIEQLQGFPGLGIPLRVQSILAQFFPVPSIHAQSIRTKLIRAQSIRALFIKTRLLRPQPLQVQLQLAHAKTIHFNKKAVKEAGCSSQKDEAEQPETGRAQAG